MKPLAPALRKAFAMMLFGDEPKDLVNSKLPTKRDCILQVEYLCLESWNVNEAIQITADRILTISNSVIGSQAKSLSKNEKIDS